MNSQQWKWASFKPLTAVIAVVCMILAACSDDDRPEPVICPGNDSFEGNYTEFFLGDESAGLATGNVDIRILAPDGSVIVRRADHSRRGNRSSMQMTVGLRDGVYRLLAASPAGKGEEEEYGLGSRIRVSASGIEVIDSYNTTLKCAGLGSKENPFIISSASHLFNLMMAVNDYDSNRQITSETYFEQVCDIDMKSMSRSCDSHYGWMPIGADTNTPFRGVYRGGGHTLKNLTISRPSTPGVGLFGFLFNAAIDSLRMQNCTVEGQYAVGTVAGAVISSGDNIRGSATITNCGLTGCTVKGNASSAMLGGILGAIDMHTTALLADCTMDGGSVSGGMNVGGLFGGAGLYSALMVSGCENSSTVTGRASGVGGIVGTADTLQVVGSRNTAAITGPAQTSDGLPGTGTGGIAGGSGYSWITGCENIGTVSGFEGVGGIIGSTRVRGSESESFLYNQSVLRYCTNSGSVSGSRFVGGAIGEAQAGGYSVCNTGTVTAADYAGGICGAASLSVIHNSFNSGTVRVTGSRAGGIIGKCTWGSLAVNQNSGKITAPSGRAGGIAGLCGNNTVIHYCANYGNIEGGSGYSGGIVGDIGEPRKWTGLDIAECVVGTLECVMALAGPSLAVLESAVEMAEAVEITIKLVETGFDVSLQITDYVLLGFGIDELLNPEAEEALEKDMTEKAARISDTNTALLGTLRAACSAEMTNFGSASLAEAANSNVERLMEWYALEGNDDIFNETINKKREQRAEKLEEIEHTKEIVHTVIAGVAVAVSTVALIGAEVASGGTATAFVMAGAAAALVGGVNAIVKSCTKFETNAVIISQCINARSVSGSDAGHTAAIAGRLCDGSVIYDCLSTVSAGENEFAGDIGRHCNVNHCIGLVAHPSMSRDNAIYQCIYADPSLKGDAVTGDTGFSNVSTAAMGKTETFTALGFSIGSDAVWTLGALPFPIPNISEMQNL